MSRRVSSLPCTKLDSSGRSYTSHVSPTDSPSGMEIPRTDSRARPPHTFGRTFRSRMQGFSSVMEGASQGR